MKAIKVTTSSKILQQDFTASNGWAVRFMYLHCRTTSAWKLLTNYLEKLIAHQQYIINLWWKHHYLLRQIGNADETRFFAMLTYTNNWVFSSDWWEEREAICYSKEKESSERKVKLPHGIKSKICRLNSKQATSVGQHEVVCEAHFSVPAWHMDARFETYFPD
jgi:hypothetical protein